MSEKSDLYIKRMRYGFNKPCRYCGLMLEWWITRKERWVGIEADTLENHWERCPHDVPEPTEREMTHEVQ